MKATRRVFAKAFNHHLWCLFAVWIWRKREGERRAGKVWTFVLKWAINQIYRLLAAPKNCQWRALVFSLFSLSLNQFEQMPSFGRSTGLEAQNQILWKLLIPRRLSILSNEMIKEMRYIWPDEGDDHQSPAPNLEDGLLPAFCFGKFKQGQS